MSTHQYFCDCPTICQQLKQVSRTTWYNHKRFRSNLPKAFNVYRAQYGNQEEYGGRGGPLEGRPTHSGGPLINRQDQQGNWGNWVEDSQIGSSDVHIDQESVDDCEGYQYDHNREVQPVFETTRQGEPLLDEAEDQDEEAKDRDEEAEDRDEEAEDREIIHLDSLKITLAFIQGLKTATLDNSGLDSNTVEHLRCPIQHPLETDDPYLRLSLELFLATTTASQDTYTNAREAIRRCYPQDQMLSYDQIKRKIADITGITSIVHDMCLNTCIAYTGPFSLLETCPECGELRYDPIQLEASGGHVKISRRQFHTIPIGPQLQAMYRSPKSAEEMGYRAHRTKEILKEIQQNGGIIETFDDVYHGQEYLNAVDRGDITSDDIVLLYSVDGAQLYQNKSSDCWMSIWSILDLRPDLRYKKKCVAPDMFIPGPNKPKHPDSFFYPSFYHLAALQHEGLVIWNAKSNTVFTSHPYFLLGTADGPGMTYLNGLTGHKGAYGCRLYCPTPGRHKPGAPTYYPAHLKPDNYTVTGCDHGDIDPQRLPPTSLEEYRHNLQYVLQSKDEAQFKLRRRQTGITKPSILSGFSPSRSLAAPGCCALDLMHLASLNITDLLLSLWRGMLNCEYPDTLSSWDWAVLQGDVWKQHGATVGSATPYIPGSFDRPPRNPAEKISSGYKAWEFLMYIFGLGPGLFYRVLPAKYWEHFCKLVLAIRLLHQRSITRHQLRRAHLLISEFVTHFEILYYQRKVERLHFCRHSLHTLLHLTSEVVRLGPLVYYTQWTMERTIGNLGEEIKQHSDPYANLSQRGVRRSQVNALKAMLPYLDTDQDTLPRGARDLGNGYVLLRAKDETRHTVLGAAGQAIHTYFEGITGQLARPGLPPPQITRWARLRLPNGQIARSAWKEKLKPLEKNRMRRNVKVFLSLDGEINFGEVQFYFRVDENHTAALISLHSPPHNTLLQSSSTTVWACRYQGDLGLRVVDVQSIQSVVALVPLPHTPEDMEDLVFVIEMFGLDVTYLSGHGVEENMDED